LQYDVRTECGQLRTVGIAVRFALGKIRPIAAADTKRWMNTAAPDLGAAVPSARVLRDPDTIAVGR
jgi:hypothetical protein